MRVNKTDYEIWTDNVDMTGIFVAVVGPSGAGKDTIIDYARERLSHNLNYHFVRRVVTRKADGNTEDHDSMSEAEFLSAIEQQAFCLHWQAHGLYYGLPSSIESVLVGGGVVIANLSRRALPQLQAHFPQLSVVNITATGEVLAQRLSARGRETAASIAQRLQRNEPVIAGDAPVLTLDNSGAVSIAGDAFVRHLQACATGSVVAV